MTITKQKIKAYALKNAIHYGGKANPGAVVSSLFVEGLKKDNVKEIMTKIQEVIKEISQWNLEKQKKEYEKLKKIVSEREVREGLPELPNVNLKTGVIMRFAPSPSGALHIGHAMTACLSYAYVKKYGGTLYIRIEDTNPENIYPGAHELIKKDAEWLFGGKAKIIIQSERMDLYYSYAVGLIEKGKAYVCTCSGDAFREFSKKKEECPCRDLSIKENVKRWEKMLNKKGYNEGDAVLRFKSLEGMQHKNPAMRDFPLARVNLTKHILQGNKYRVWPLMNLAVTVDDIDTNMTHIIRAKEHRDNAKRQEMIYAALGLSKKFPWVGFLGRIHLKGLRLSASGMAKDIAEKKYSGWDDLRLPTVASLKKQGYSPEAFLKLSEHIGLNEVDKTLDKKEYFKLLDTFNSK